MFKLVVLISLLTSSLSSLGDSGSCSKKGTVVIYSNGLDSSRSNTIRSLLLIRQSESLLNPKIDKNPDIVPEYIWHHNSRFQDNDEGILSRYKDFVTTTSFLAKTKAKQDYNLDLSEEKQMEFIINSATGFSLDTPPTASSVPAVLILIAEQVAQYLLGEIQQASIANPQENARNLVEMYRRYLNLGKRVLAITHGEGSIINNASYDLTFDQGFEIIGLPSEVNAPAAEKRMFFVTIQIAPATEVLSRGTYRTLIEDKYYDDIYSKLNFSAPGPNFSYSPIPAILDPWLHSFPDTYLAEGIKGSGSDYSGTLGGIIEVAEMLKSDCGQPPISKFTYKSRALDPLFPNSMTYDFDGSTSTDADEPDPNDPTPVEPPDFDIDKFEWLVDGSIPLTGMNPSFTFLTEGPHTVQLVVTDKQGAKSEPLEQLLTVINIAPKADFTYSKQDLKVTFDGSTSKDVDGKIAEYRWKVEGVETILTTSTFIYTYENGGIFDVELTVVDSNGKVSTPITRPVIFSSVGCEDSQGNLFPGTIHVNPDGTPGGYVANTASVASSVIISKDSQVCGYARIKGDVQVTFKGVVDNSVIDNTNGGTDITLIQTSKVIDSGLVGKGHLFWQNSTLRNSQISGYKVSASRSLIRDSTIDSYFLSMDKSTINSSTLTRPATYVLRNFDQYAYIQTSTLNSVTINSTETGDLAPIVIFNGIINADISGASIIVDHSTVDTPMTENCISFGYGFISKITRRLGCP